MKAEERMLARSDLYTHYRTHGGVPRQLPPNGADRIFNYVKWLETELLERDYIIREVKGCLKGVHDGSQQNTTRAGQVATDFDGATRRNVDTHD